MRRLLLIAAVSALAVAKPDLYKEKEDFQYSRSSSDDGTKSGFYGAQRGNMGGNFERAHNMDGLAQHQMGGLVRQVEGELGDGSKTRTGSVFTAANSRGVYGSGHYDLSNLEGRNFQEGTSYGDSQSQSALNSQSGFEAQSSASNNAAYRSSHSHSSRYHSGFSGYHSSGLSGQASNLQGSTGHSEHENNLQAGDRVSQYDYGGQAASGQYASSGYHGQGTYDQTRSSLRHAGDYGSNTQSKVIALPVRVVVTPGTRVAIPLPAQTYDASQYGAAYDQNSISNQAELLTNHDQQTLYKSSNQPKHYESAYSYRKEWEKHDTVPVSMPEVTTVSPFPKNSELYEDTQAHISGHEYDSTGTNSQKSLSSGSYSSHNADLNSALSSQARYQSTYNNQHQRKSSASIVDAYIRGAHNSAVSANNQIEDVSKPKSYQSSYSYHKSWERQGDPYVIKPASNVVYDGQTSQRLTAASSNQGAWSSHNYGSHSQHSNQNYPNVEDCDCDENGHIRVARSYNAYDIQEGYHQNQNVYDQAEQLSQNLENLENLGQQTQSVSGKLEDFGQQSVSENLEDFGQQSVSSQLENLGQQSVSGKLEDFGQQSVSSQLEDFGQQTQSVSDKLENLGQQTQTQWDNIGSAGQQVQNNWDHFNAQPNQHNQHTQNTWSTSETGNQDIYGQQTLNKWHNSYSTPQEKHIENASPQGTLNQPKIFTGEHFGPQYTPQQNVGVHTQYFWNVDGSHQKPTNYDSTVGKHVSDFGPYTFHTYPTNFHNIGYNNMPWGLEKTDTQNVFRQNSQINSNNYWNRNVGSHTQYSWQEHVTSGNSQTHYETSTKGAQTLSSLWDKIDNIEKQSTSSMNKDEVNTNENSFTQGYQTLQNSHINPGQQIYVVGALTQTQQNKRIIPHYVGYHPWQTNTFNDVTSTTELSNDHNKVDHFHTSDIGRGDIGSDDLSDDKTATSTSTTESVFHTVLVPGSIYKSYKTPEEIEALSLTNVRNKNTTISANTPQSSDEKSLHQSNNEASSGSSSITSNTQQSTTEYKNNQPSYTIQPQSPQVVIQKEDSLAIVPSNNISDQNIQSDKDNQFAQDTNLKPTETQMDKDQGPVQVNQQNIETQSKDFGLQIENIHQLNKELNFEQQGTTTEHINLGKIDKQVTEQSIERQVSTLNKSNAENFNQHNTDKQFTTIEKQSENLAAQNAYQPINEQQGVSFDQQNTDQQFETLGQESENLTPLNAHNSINLEQQVNSFHQQNTDQQFETLGQQSERVAPQNTDNLINVDLTNSFDQQNTDQQFETLGQESENLTPLNAQNSINLGQQVNSFDQHNTDQQFETLGQEIENLTPLNAHNLINLEQQVNSFDQQNTDQQFETLGQQSESVAPQNTDNLINVDQTKSFDQQNTDQQFETLGQQSENLTPLNAHSLINLEQQINSFDQQNTDQQFETLGQESENLTPLNAHNSINLEQQVNSFDQQNTDQQFETLGQQSERVAPQNTDNLINVEQQINSFDQQNTDQQFETLGQESENLTPLNAHNLINVEQQINSFDQQNTDQQFETLGQQSEKLTPLNANDMINLEPQSSNFNQQNTEQQFETIGQQSEHLTPQNTANLGNFWQQISTFDQQNRDQNVDALSKPNEDVAKQNTNNIASIDQPSNTLYSQNTDQQFRNNGQQYHHSQMPNYKHLEDLGQQPRELEVIPKDNAHKTEEHEAPNKNDEIKNIEIVESVQSETDKNVDSPPEPTTEKSGFWASVGNKFSSAKDKVSSWFRTG